jgi:hypothetical protein
MNPVTEHGIGILFRHIIETRCVVRWQKGRRAALAWNRGGVGEAEVQSTLKNGSTRVKLSGK